LKAPPLLAIVIYSGRFCQKNLHLSNKDAILNKAPVNPNNRLKDRPSGEIKLRSYFFGLLSSSSGVKVERGKKMVIALITTV